MKNQGITLRLIIMNFLQYAIWGAYLTSMGSFLGKAGLGPQIWLFFATQGFVSIFMPALMGIVADKWVPAQKTLSLCQGLAAVFMIATGLYAMNHVSFVDGAYVKTADFTFSLFYILYTLSVAFYMPTIAISNSVAYNALEVNGKDPVKDFPPIRVFGTIGFICAMLFVNFTKDGNGVQFQMDTLTQIARSGAPICLLEVKTPYEAYLGDLDKQEIINLKDQQQQLNKYCGLKIGDLETANNNAGNWE